MGSFERAQTVMTTPVELQPHGHRHHPLLTVVFSVLCFLALDNLLFRSGLYDLLVSPVTTGGKLVDMVRFNKALQTDPARDVLLMGNSRTEWGFGTGDFAQIYPHAIIRPLMGAVPGSNIEWWFYQLRAQDPHHDRYAAIVIPLDGYRAAPLAVDQQNRYDTAQVLAPIIHLRDWMNFLAHFNDPAIRARARWLAIFSSHDYSLDLQDLLLHPLARFHARQERDRIGPKWLDNWRGAPESIEALRLDPISGKPIAYPPEFNAFRKNETDAEFIRPPPGLAQSWTVREADFQATWIRRIVMDYEGSRTRIIFLNIPHQPMPLPALQPIAGAPDLRSAIPDAPNVVVLPEDQFTDLETPKYFVDVLHLNAAGRLLFTRRLGQTLQDLLTR
jgi:hypothetical protein